MKGDSFQTAHAVVTGGGRGIGAAVSRELAGRVSRLTLMGRALEALERHALDLAKPSGLEVQCVRCDVSDEESVVAAFAEAQKRFGPACILVNCAGQAEAASFLETSRSFWDRMLLVNLTGTYLCTRQVLAAMLQARAGRIVNVASVAGLRGYSHVAAYAAAKHGVIGLTRALAAETARCGVTVNAVCPGYVEGERTERAITELAKATGKERDRVEKMLLRNNPRRALIRPEEVASVVGWLCSAEASAMTGQAISVTAGEVT